MRGQTHCVEVWGDFRLFTRGERQQNAALLLGDVSNRLHMRFKMTAEFPAKDSPEKFLSMLNRRADAGQCFNQP